MARKKSTKTPPKSEVVQGEFFCAADAAWGGFVNINLSDVQKDEFRLWFEAEPSGYTAIVREFLLEGGKISITFDREHDCYIVTFTGALMGGSADRFAASSRAGILDEALALMAWKHGFLAEGDYGNWRPFGNTMDHWG